MMDDRRPQGLLVTECTASARRRWSEEVADLLEQRRLAYAAIDVDWLGWFWASDEATARRIQLANLADVVQRYLAVGVYYVALAHSVPDRGRWRSCARW
jgi:hypothetical protein